MRTSSTVVVVAGIVLFACGGALQACGGDDANNGGGTPDGGGTGNEAGGGNDATTGSDGGSDGSSDAAHPTDGASPTDGSQSDSATPSYDPSVYQHHKNPTRDGVYTDPAMTKTAAAGVHVLTGFMGTTSAGSYAQPLYVKNGPGGNEAFIIATETNHLTALNATTGAVLWDTMPSTIGVSVTAGLPCGNINPLGITGTPVIDPATGTIYFDAMTTPDGNATAKHLVYAAKMSDGTIVSGWPVDVQATVTGFTSNIQNQRGALQLLNGVLYVPYGGLDDDCDNYYGWVIGFPVATPQTPTGWHTMATKGGIWGTGALPTDGTSVFPVTGNTPGANTWGGGEAVIRLAAGPTFSGNTTDYYAPTDWKTNLDAHDLDLGGASEVVFDMPNAPKPHLIVAGGKDGKAYVLDRDNLGGIGGELVATTVATGQIKGAPAVYTTSMGTYAAFNVQGGGGVACPGNTTGNLVAVKINPGTTYTTTVAWCSDEGNLGSPMVTTTDGTSNAIVWDASNKLYAYDGDTGMKIVDGTMTPLGSNMQYFNTPIDANGRMVVGINGKIIVFTP
jgi:hypothetical protein